MIHETPIPPPTFWEIVQLYIQGFIRDVCIVITRPFSKVEEPVLVPAETKEEEVKEEVKEETKEEVKEETKEEVKEETKEEVKEEEVKIAPVIPSLESLQEDVPEKVVEEVKDVKETKKEKKVPFLKRFLEKMVCKKINGMQENK